jgi:hypothetical protein
MAVSSPSWIIKGSGRYDSFQSRNEKRNLNAVTAPTVVGFLSRFGDGMGRGNTFDQVTPTMFPALLGSS